MDEYESFAVAYTLDEYPGDKSLSEIFQLILAKSEEVKHSLKCGTDAVIKIQACIKDLREVFRMKSEEDKQSTSRIHFNKSSSLSNREKVFFLQEEQKHYKAVADENSKKAGLLNQAWVDFFTENEEAIKQEAQK